MLISEKRLIQRIRLPSGRFLVFIGCVEENNYIIDRVHHHLFEQHCTEQSGFTPKRSTIDRILAIRVLTKRRREFRQGLLAAYVDLCNAFDSVNPDALWRIIGLRGVPPKLIDLMSVLWN